MAAILEKLCNKCGVTKPLGEYWRASSRPDGLQYYCKSCQTIERAEYMREWTRRHPDYKRDLRLRRVYGLTQDLLAELEAAQNGLCLICSGEFGPEMRPVVDHDHESGEVRGLLCKQCNFGLGAFRDNKDALRAAIEYLERG